MADYESVLLNAVSANGTGPVTDIGEGDVTDRVSVQVIIAGTVSAFSVQVQGSLDGTNFANIGSAISAAGLSALSSPPPCRYFRAVLSGYTGTGTVTALMEFIPLA